jgi:hypothetical protein
VVPRRTIKNKENRINPINQKNPRTKYKTVYYIPVYGINFNHNKTKQSFAKYGEPGTTKLYK